MPEIKESTYIRRELTVAGESQKLIIPFRIKDAKPQGGLRIRLSDLHWIDGFDSRLRAIDEVLKALDPGSTPLLKTLPPKKAIGRRSVVGNLSPLIIGAGVVSLFILGALIALENSSQTLRGAGSPMPDAGHEKAGNSRR